ncbi:MAG: 2-amino-4-hydroxy-6-hydroxymethyldihydropteridine diphosphokinase [Bacteroidia bacterium]|nr:2-amino-4-hydroxy-6-hydroxymethyldihydropteridine diphosphokinase [Bacteroidia bacterium]
MNIAETTVYLGLGSNLGDRTAMLQAAVDHIADLGDTMPLRCSAVYETSPWGEYQQPGFLNCVLEVVTTLEPPALFEQLKQIERTLGRVPGPKNGPRIIDIDILLYGERVLQSDDLRIPHPMMEHRNFVLVPLRDLAPLLKHPVSGHTISELALRCPDSGSVTPTDFRLYLHTVHGDGEARGT